jgi:hypothetical protein
MLFVGDDWAEDHHDVEVVDDAGRMLARRRLPEGLEGVTRLHALIAEQMPDDVLDLNGCWAVVTAAARRTRAGRGSAGRRRRAGRGAARGALRGGAVVPRSHRPVRAGSSAAARSAERSTASLSSVLSVVRSSLLRAQEVSIGCTQTNDMPRSAASWPSTRHRCPVGSQATVTPA